MRRHRLLPLLLALLLSGTAAACSSGDPDAPVRAAAATFLDAWAQGHLDAAAQATDNPAAAKTALTRSTAGLDPVRGRLEPGAVARKDATATVAFTANWTLQGVPQPWSYHGRLAMTKKSDSWQVHWQPDDLHPKLTAGQHLAVARTLPPRASILDSSGKPLFSQVPVVTVGIEPQRVKNLPQLAATLAATLHITAGDIVDAVHKAKPTAFVPVITLRRADYLSVRSKIHDLPGTVFQTGTKILAPTAHFAQPLLGSVGDATADVLKELGNGYAPGDQVGLSGLQRAFNKQLAGTAGADIEIVPDDDKAGGTPVTRLAHVQGHPGTPLRTTLDRRVQDAADAALAGVTQHAAIVAIRPSTGAILAVANSASAPYDIALSGRYPAGSTFKVITSTAVLHQGVARADTRVGCPGKVTIAGRVFPNENNFDLGTISLETAFAHSCNTTFTKLSQQLDDGALTTAAAQYGIGAGWQLPVDSFSGSIPAPSDAVEKAADAIGQGKVLVSPLAEALMAATVVHGSAPAPMLVAGQPATAKNTPAAPPADVLPTLRTFMRAVVTDGTARSLRGVPGGPVSGKTGTAEHGSGRPLQAHSWFMGFQPMSGGDLAFAVFVENGQTSGQLALPRVAKFLTGLH